MICYVSCCVRNKSDYKNPQRVKGSPDFRRGVCRPPSGVVRHAFCAAASTRTLGAQTDGEGAILAQAGFLYIALNAASGIFFCIFINKDGDDMLDICLPGTGGTPSSLSFPTRCIPCHLPQIRGSFRARTLPQDTCFSWSCPGCRIPPPGPSPRP